MLDGRFSNAPHVPRASAFLDSGQMIRDPVSVFEKYRAQLGPTFSFHFGGARRAIVSTDPDVIAHVLKKNRENYQKSDIQVKYMVEFQGEGLVNIHGDAWKRQRKLVAQGFRADRLSELLPVQIALLDELMAGFDAEAAAGPVDVHAQMVRLTLGLVGKSIFGRAMTDAELQQIADTISAIQGFIVRQIVQPYLIPWFRISGQSERYQQLRRDADQIVLRHIQQRRDAGTGELDFLRILLETPYMDTGEPMGEAQAMVEALQLMVAGNETSSNGLTWVLYLLGQHPEHLPRIRQEVDTILGEGPITFEALHRLDWTMKVIYEALRLYPPFWMIDRIALEDDNINGIHVPKGALVIPYIYGTHRNPALWAEPERFEPSRFDREKRRSRPTFGYIPFGGGPRLCVGNNMAIMQMLLIVALLVRRYDIAAAGGAVGIRPMMLLRPDGAVQMRFDARG
ncbi:MAG: cytochrome P450 [Myxococcota bacterium]